MICYVCSRDATHRIYGDLKPVCRKHLVEAVDEEGGDIMISTIDAEVNHAPRFEAVADLLRKLYDIRKEPIKYALCDLSDWLEYDLDKVMNQLDELQYEVENQVNEGESA